MPIMKNSCKTCHWFNAGDSMGRGTCLHEKNVIKVKTARQTPKSQDYINTTLHAGVSGTDWCFLWTNGDCRDA